MLKFELRNQKKMCFHMKHLTLSQRYKIEALLSLKKKKAEIAREIGVHRSTISRELNKHSLTGDSYNADHAHYLYQKTKREAGKIRAAPSEKLMSKIHHYLDKQLSPEQIAGRLAQEKMESRSHSWIYRYLWTDKISGGQLYRNLRRSGKKNRKKYGSAKGDRGRIRNRVSIEKRPKIVDKMSRIGDWEADTIIGKNHKGTIVSLTERRSMTQLLRKVKSKSTKDVCGAIIKMIRDSGLPALTMTFDNGMEFSEHEKIGKALQLKTYFAHPYCSYERGLNENQNGLVRQYIPKKVCFSKVSQQQVRKIQDLLNIRPRKSLDYLSPKEFVAIETQIELDTKITLESKSCKSAFVT